MKILFAVNDSSISDSIVKKYQSMYKEIIIGKNVYYFNAIIKELQKDKSYDRIVISEDLEPFTSNNFETIDNFLFEKLDNISDEATTYSGKDIPIILITTDRRSRTDEILIRLFGIGIYSSLIGKDRSIEKICELIQKPRSKKEAKIYYKIESREVGYKPENEGNVSESEIQNILSYFKRLGKNEERYVESFNSIVPQYSDQQLKVIIKFLPQNVKNVLEENSPKYQELIASENKNFASTNDLNGKRKRKSKSKKENNGITISSIPSNGNKLTKPVIIPSAKKVAKIQEDTTEDVFERFSIKQEEIKQEDEETKKDVEKNIKEEVKEEKKDMEEEVSKKRGRGRPRKVKTEVTEKEEIVEQAPKRKRGRPRKNPIVEEEKVESNNEIDDVLEFGDFEEENNTLPGVEKVEQSEDDNENDFLNFDDFEAEESKDDEISLSDFGEEFDVDNEETNDEEDIEIEDDEELQNTDEDKEDEDEDYFDTILPGFDDEDEENEEEEYDNFSMLPGFEDEELEPEQNTTETQEQTNDQDVNNQFEEKNELENYKNKPTALEKLLTNNQKIVAFVGTTKNGTSFLINNIAEMLSNQGIRTAIVDLTSNKNSYYVYTKNDEQLRKRAFNCMEKLTEGIAEGIKVNNNLDVYTSLPGEDHSKNSNAILETLVKNYSLILLDCDFKSNYAYLKEAQEIYLVQSMDVLTIQPLTAYLRELKAKEILNPNKLKAVINKYTRVRGISERAIIGGMAFYNDPAMAYMTELFNRETIPYCTIPFDSQVYAKYLEALINCNISIAGYTKDFINNLRKLANMVYPLIPTEKTNKKEKYDDKKYNKYATGTFSKDVNSTLDKMRKNY